MRDVVSASFVALACALAQPVAAQNEERGVPITQAPGLRIVIDGGVLAEIVPGRADRGMSPRSGDFLWQDAGTTRTIRNTGTTRIEFVEFELK